ncbi:MAG TPA: NAD(P)/FAD-dependent oxidoreductase [Cyanophyceae cyanobacterium]
MIQSPTHICILGGGFGGLYTALSLQRFRKLKSHNCKITLIERKDHFLFTPLLYELITGELQPWEIAPSYEKLLANTTIQFCQNTVQNVDLDLRQVLLEDGTLLNYDYLVLSVGSATRLQDIPGATSWAIPFRSLADVHRLQEKLQLLETSEREHIRVAVVGGGPNGVELACKIADRLGKRGRVRLIERGGEILKTFPPKMRAIAYRAIKTRRIQVDLETQINAIAPDSITLIQNNQETVLPVDIVLWTVGTRPWNWVRNLPCSHNNQAQLIVHPTLQLIDYPEVLALGDLAEIQDTRKRPIPATAQAAYQQADCAAANLWAIMTHRPLRRFHYLHLGDMMTLGINAAVVSSFGVHLGGFLASLIRRFVYLQRLPTLRHRLQVLRHWIASWILQLPHGGRQKLARLFVRNSAMRKASAYQRRSN